MKKLVLVGYVMIASVTMFLQSCQDDPIVPNGVGSEIDTTWVSDSTGNNGGGNGNPIDTTGNNGGGNGNPIDSTNWGGGNGNPGDTL
jgi:hypothetical protein